VSRSVSLETLRIRSKQLANVVNDASFDDEDVNQLVRLYVPTVHDMLVAAGMYIASETPVAVTAGTTVYGLPADFLSLECVWVLESSDYRRPLDPVPERQRQHYRSPITDASVILEYCSAAPLLEDDSDTFDAVDGFDELVSAKVARDLIAKREGDPSVVMSMIATSEQRIRSHSTQRHRGGPKMIVDLESDCGWPRSVQLDGFRLRGDNIEFYSSLWGPFV
jgi:hypothetical protein